MKLRSRRRRRPGSATARRTRKLTGMERLEPRLLLSHLELPPAMAPLDEQEGWLHAAQVETLPEGLDPMDLPTSYDLRSLGYVTPVKDQGACSSCWAFAAFASLESNILMGGGPAEDFSEYHLIANRPHDMGTCGTGNVYVALSRLAGGHDPEDESDDPYPFAAGGATGHVASLDTVEYYVREGLFFDTVNEIKQALMTRGALSMSMHYDQSSFDSTSEYHYYSGEEETNHAVVIAGWDDEIDMSAVGAPGPGAWLIKDSHGMESHGDGYFWLSYHDRYGGAGEFVSVCSISDPALQPETFLRVYDHDDFGHVTLFAIPYAFNAFTAAGHELLTAVNFWTAADGASYDLRIYDTFADGSLSGLLSQQTGTAAYLGNHTVNLNKPVGLAPGDDFYVYLHITDGGEFSQAADKRKEGFSSACTASPGESFCSSNGTVWHDLQAFNETANFCIKALTSRLPEVTDFGDAPAPYPTRAPDGAAHRLIPAFCLGEGVDHEADGQPHADARGDDQAGTDDEDGVRLLRPLMPGQTAALVVTASKAGVLDAWIDLNDDGDWDDGGERVLTNKELSAGANVLHFAVAGDATVTEQTFARFRLSGAGVAGPGGPAPEGEVEDYAVAIVPAAPLTFHVDDSAEEAGGDGTNWQNAFIELQEALWAAVPGDQIRVAQGTYLPDWDGLGHCGDRDATFRLQSGVALSGGYAGWGAADPDARDPVAYETVLSGEIGVPDQIADNSRHVVAGSGTDATAVLDGFTVTTGNCWATNVSAEDEPNYCGAGMLNRQGSPTVTHCAFRGNVGYGGAGMANYQDASPTVTECTFTGNQARYGGGMMNFEGSSPRVTGCTFDGNVVSIDGGGMLNGKYAKPILTGCAFNRNSAGGRGGGLANCDDADATIVNTRFVGNKASDCGGGVANVASSPTLVNCTWSVNIAGGQGSGHGGGLANCDGSNPIIACCTLSRNVAKSSGGGLANVNQSAPAVTNTIVWRNMADTGQEIYNHNATPSLGWCDVEGGLQGPRVRNAAGGSIADAGGNLDADPLFVLPPAPGTDHLWGTADDQPGNLRLEAESPLVDRGCSDGGALPADTADLDADGDVSERTPLDLAGALRLIDDPAAEPNQGAGLPPVLDVGAYECTAGVTTATVQGRLLNDLDGDGEPDADEPGLVHWKVYLDLSDDGQWQQGEPYRRTDAQGRYTLADVAPGSYTLRQVLQPGWQRSWPEDTDGYPLTLSAAEVAFGKDFGNESVAFSQDVLYVDDTATGDGSGADWPNAVPDLQAALEAAAAAGKPMDLYVAQGRYVPTAETDPGDPRTATFQLLSGIRLYGGFADGGCPFDQRDPGQYETIFSGDFNGDDEADFTNYAENAYHVVTASGVDATAVLDGLVISGGYSEHYSPDEVGGGLFNEGGSPMLTGCTFRDNYARTSGGGMYNNQSSNLSLTECTFERNKVMDLGGGGMHNVATQVTLTDCTFKANISDKRAGAVYNDAGAIVMTGCLFESTSGYGGGDGWVIYSAGSTLSLTSCQFTATANPVGSHDCIVTIAGCTFEDNLTGWGEGKVVANSGTTTAELRGCTFRNNGRAVLSRDEAAVTVVDCAFITNEGRSGAGLNHTGSGPLTVANCEFVGNTTGGYGSGMYVEASGTVLVTNCMFIGNRGGVGSAGGGMYVTNSPDVKIANCTFAANTAWGYGGLRALDCIPAPALSNSIFWGNMGGGSSLGAENASGGTYSHCLIQGSGGSGEAWDATVGTDDGGNIDTDPLFSEQPDAGADGTWGTDDDQTNVRLRGNSPAIDAGDNDGVPPDAADLDFDADTAEATPVDLDRWPRFLDSPVPDTGLGTPAIVDMGAYEQQSADAGDAPAPYPTTGPDGAYHVIVEGVHLGAAVDSDPGAQPTPYADGDDRAETDDEDGVEFLDPLVTGQQVWVIVTASQPGFLDAWIDFSDDGDWEDEGEQIFPGEELAAGEKTLSFTVPDDAVPTELTFGRFRFSTAGGLSPRGWAEDGEVEDYNLVIRRAESRILYVNDTANGVGTGEDWPNAYPDLQSALQMAVPGDRIWVAEGQYRPSQQTDPADARTATFQLRRGIELYGGFPEAGGDWDDRSPSDHETTLCGDLGAPGESADNAYHVVTATGTDATAVLDGFTITAGLADGSGLHDRGGGILAADHADLTIRNCTIVANGGDSAAGMYLGSGSPLIVDSRFLRNSAEAGGGGALWSAAASPTIVGTTFDDNDSSGRGGAIRFTDGSRPEVTNCRFVGNHSNVEGGGMSSEDSFPNIQNAVFEENLGRTGGAFYNGGSSVAVVAGSTFYDNGAQTIYYGVGGAIQNADAASATVVNCTFTANRGYKRGGGGAIAHGASAELVVVNSVFIANSGGLQWNKGGAILHDGSGPLALANSVFIANLPGGGHGAGVALVGEGQATVAGCTFTAHSGAEALMLGQQGPRTVANTILWDNPGGQVGDDSGTTNFAYCDIQACGGSGEGWDVMLGIDGGGNLDADPQFVDPAGPGLDNIWGTDDDRGDLRLRESSPAIDAGDNTAVPPDAADVDFDGVTDEPTPRDLDHKARFSDVPEVPDTGNGTPPVVDIGAYERPVLDFGDAPAPYPTTGDQAACHSVSTGFYLGDAVDAEQQGQPEASARGDDHDADGDDEDGVRFLRPLMVGVETSLVVTASTEGYLDAWVDFNDDGVWSGDDRAFPPEPLDAGENTVSFVVPAEATATQQTFARFRFSSTGNLEPGGPAPDGEVEDYEVAILPASALVFYVDDTAAGTHDGESWPNAFPDLQDALSAAVAGDVIYVAEGTYRPSRQAQAGQPCSATFHLEAGVTLYGGFPDGGDTFDQRNWVDHPAILSGELGSPDDASDNAWHVVTGSGVDTTAILDGFTVTAGNADGAAPHDAGGGILSEGGSPTLLNCTFDANAAGRGGALAALAGAAPSLASCTLSDNDAADGGAVFLDASEVTLADCTLRANRATGAGGAVSTTGTLAVARGTFSDNQAAAEGGAISNAGDVRLINVRFEGNQATGDGGAIHNAGAVSLANAVFSGNAADADGGAVANSGTMTLTNATFVRNRAGQSGGGVQNTGDLALANTILWDDLDQGESDEVHNDAGQVSFRYCDVRGGWDGDNVVNLNAGTATNLDGNRNADPLLVAAPGPGPDATWGTEDDDYGDLKLRPSSPLIDAGDNDAVPADANDLDGDGLTDEPLPLDLDDTQRFADNPDTADSGNPGVPGPPLVDIGAYEWGAESVLGFLQGRAWNDLNHNGTPDAGEPGIEGRRILVDVNGNGQADPGEPQKDTDANGEYAIDVPPGTYTVAQELPSGWQATFPALTGTHTVTLEPGQVQVAPFGSRQIGDGQGSEIRGRKIRDGDGDGQPDLGQTGLPNWEIYLDLNDNGEHDGDEPITPTGPDGSYAFTNLAAGSYVVREQPRAGWEQTYPANGDPQVVDLADGGVAEGRNFLNRPLGPPLAGIFVDDTAGGANDGSSWQDAFTNLQSALSVASPGDCIYVAEGTYTPSAEFEPGGSYSVTFRPGSGVELYGGFPDGGGSAPERDPNAYPTILSGDLAGDDGPNWTNRLDNAFRVVVCQGVQGVVIDGFGITGGQAEGRNARGRITCGAGLHVRMASVTVRNCTFRHNRAGGQGGGMSVYGVPANPSAATLINCRFVENVNSSATWGGGGLYTLWEATVEVTGCEFIRNTASNGSGGAMTNDSTQVAVTNCTFLGNKAARFGGGIYNAAQYGTSHGTAGAAHSPLIANSVFVGNTAGNSGGGMTNDTGTRPVLTNCTFSANGAGVHGGAIHAISGGTWQLASNCIFWNNTSYVRYWHTGNELSSGPPPHPRYDYCIIRDAEIYPGAYSGTNIRAVDPQFVRAPDPGDDDVWGTEDDDYGDLRLQAGSPAIDAGNAFAVAEDFGDVDGDLNRSERLPLDFDGSPRCVNDPSVADTGWPQNGWPLVDLGAFESHHLPPPDVTGDGKINTADVYAMTISFAGSDAQDEWNALYDLNGDTMLNVLDLFALGGVWGQLAVLEGGGSGGDQAGPNPGGGAPGDEYQPSMGLTAVPYFEGLPLIPKIDGHYELHPGNQIELRIFARDLRDFPQGVVVAAMDLSWTGANFVLLDELPLADLGGTTVYDARQILGGGPSGQASPFDNWFTCGGAETKVTPLLGKLGGLAGVDTDGMGTDGLDELFAAATLDATVADPADGQPMPHLAPLAGAGTAEAALVAVVRLQAAAFTGGETATVALDRWEGETLLSALYTPADPNAPLPLTHYDVAFPEPLEFVIVPEPEIAGRYVLYDNSAFDDPGRGLADDDAVAPDPDAAGEPWLGKAALLPGRTATFQNYTSYEKGINGLVIDVADLPTAALAATNDPDTSDFEFRLGNDNDPDLWRSSFDTSDPVPLPQSVTVREDVDGQGTDRVTLTWNDYAIRNTWLQVTVRATDKTGLHTEDVFYFGNAVGECGDSADNAVVNTTDEILARSHAHSPRNPAAVVDAYDYNRDGMVNVTDRIIARNHRTGPVTALRLITVPAAPGGHREALRTTVDAGPPSPSGTAEPAGTPAWAHDAVLEQATRGESRQPRTSLGKLAWLLDAEQMNTRLRPSKKARSVEKAAVDLLADDWR